MKINTTINKHIESSTVEIHEAELYEAYQQLCIEEVKGLLYELRLLKRRFKG